MKPRRRMPRICRRFIARAATSAAWALLIAFGAMALGLTLARLS